jgi:hypothetical protein
MIFEMGLAEQIQREDRLALACCHVVVHWFHKIIPAIRQS